MSDYDSIQSGKEARRIRKGSGELLYFEYLENQLEGLGKSIRIQEMRLENIALMSYARNRRRTTEAYDRKNIDTKVLLMDNPFGPISSDHQLKPLFDIAKKYNTQLICLTDLKQNSIMNQFKVIFMMKIVPNTTGTMEYLKVEESAYDRDDNPVEENLEMLNYYQEEEQMSLLGDEF